MKQPEKGDFLKFTVFKWHELGSNVAEPPLWGRCMSGDKVFIFCGGNEEMQRDMDVQDAGGFIFTRTLDVYEIVPEDKVPDEVWAAIAKRALLG